MPIKYLFKHSDHTKNFEMVADESLDMSVAITALKDEGFVVETISGKTTIQLKGE